MTFLKYFNFFVALINFSRDFSNVFPFSRPHNLYNWFSHPPSLDFDYFLILNREKGTAASQQTQNICITFVQRPTFSTLVQHCRNNIQIYHILLSSSFILHCNDILIRLSILWLPDEMSRGCLTK